MGRSVSYPTGAIVAYRALECEKDDDWEWVYEDLVEFVIHSVSDVFPSLESYDGWRGREDRILLRNAYADLGVSVYGSLAAIWLVARDDGRYWDGDMRCSRTGRTGRWIAQVKNRFLEMFSEYRCIGRFSNGEAIYEAVQAA
jgi:hypothetical protein